MSDRPTNPRPDEGHLVNPPGSLTVGERDRWRRTETLFGLPHNDAEAHMFAFLARHLLPSSMAVFEDLVRRSNGAAASRMGALVREVAEQIDRKHPVSSGDWAVIALPTGLVTRIQEAAR